MKLSILITIWLAAACAPRLDATPSAVARTGASLAPTVLPTPSPTPGPISGSGRSPNPSPSTHQEVLAGVVEARPHGWFQQASIEPPVGFPRTGGEVYGPGTIEVPPAEGPGRFAFYETIPADPSYLESRVAASRRHGSRARTVIVDGHVAHIWVNRSTGELLLGWELPGKSEVLVANTADFTVAQLVRTAESIADCCG